MKKTFYLVLDWQTRWISWCWVYAFCHLKSVCVWSMNKLFEKLCCGSASWGVTLRQSVPLDFLVLGGDGAASLGLGAAAASSCSGLLQPGLESPRLCCCGGSFWGWGGSALALWSSLRISFCSFFEEDAVVVSPKQIIPDLNNLKSVPANCKQMLMKLFTAFPVPEKCPLQISGCPPWTKDRTWEKLGQEVYWLYCTTIVDLFRIIQKALFFSVSSFF